MSDKNLVSLEMFFIIRWLQAMLNTRIAKPRFTYAITFTTSSPGFDAHETRTILEWCRHNSDACMLVEEVAATRHLHAAFRCTQKTTVQVTRMICTLYERMKLPWVPKVSVRVRKMTELVGWFHYLKKDLGDKQPLLLTGWKMTWITEQCLENLKKIPHKMLLKQDYQVTSKTGVAIVIEYAKRNNLPLCDKFTFADCITDMAKECYTFDSVRVKWLFCQVMARCGHPRFMKSHILNELAFLDD